MFTSIQREQLMAGAAGWGLSLDEATLDRFAQFAELLEEGNRRINLTRIAPEDVVPLHFLDSLALASVLKPGAGMQVMDVGTGAGFPGIPLALVFPETRFCLLDGTRKRLDFLDEVITSLRLTNVQTVHGRAEEMARLSEHRSHYDLVAARAVAKMPVLAGWLLPLVRPGGTAAAYKSREVEEEMAGAEPVVARLGGRVERIADVTLPGTDIVRKLIVIRKQSPERAVRAITATARRRR